MKKLTTLLLAGCLLGIHPAYAAADISSERRAGIEQLLELTHALAIGQQMSNAMVRLMSLSLKAAHPNIPQKVLDALPEEVNKVVAENAPALQEQLIGIYAEYFSKEDIDGMLAFYSTELGKKTIRVMPMLLQEGVARGAQWGQSLGPKIEQRLRDRFKNENIDL